MTCCYAVQNKVWATDPDGNKWEVYVVLDNDGTQHHSTQSACCADKPDCCEDKAACCTALPDSEGAVKPTTSRPPVPAPCNPNVEVRLMPSQPSTDAIWTHLSSDLRRFIRRRVSDDHVADDLLQETFVRVHRNIGTLQEADRLAAWVYRIARNVIHDHHRKATNATVAPRRRRPR